MYQKIEKPGYQKGLSSFELKFIMILSMFLDHIGIVFYPESGILRIIGRMAYPIACFLLCNGFQYSSDRIKYLERFLVFAILSEIPFDLAFEQKLIDREHQSVFITLFLALFMLLLLEKETETSIKIMIVSAILSISLILHSDYSGFGLLLVLVFYYCKDLKKQFFSFLAINSILVTRIQPLVSWMMERLDQGEVITDLVHNPVVFNHLFKIHHQDYAIVVFVFLLMYNGQEGKKCKPLFYLFYPGHMILISMISYLLH